MRENITGGGDSEGNTYEIQPVEYERGWRDVALVKRISELETTLQKIIDTAQGNGEDCSYLIAKRALE